MDACTKHLKLQMAKVAEKEVERHPWPAAKRSLTIEPEKLHMFLGVCNTGALEKVFRNTEGNYLLFEFLR